MRDIQELTDELICLSGNYIFPEYYAHTDCLMWKIMNPFTNLKSDKRVLSKIDEPIGQALELAISEMRKCNREAHSE